MTEHVYRKFSNHIGSIQALLEKDAAFGEICNDYEEICTWLTSQSHPEDRSPGELDRARRLIRDLEDEILKALEERL